MMNKFYTKSLFGLLSLFLFLGNANAQQLTITEPAGIAGDYAVILAEFGTQLTDACGEPVNIMGTMVSGTQDGGLTTACADDGAITSDVSGKIAFVDRGACAFTQKAEAAAAAGAIAVVICNNAPPEITGLSGESDVTIPVVLIQSDDCATIRAEFGVNNVVGSVNNSLAFPEDENSDDTVLWESTFDGSLDGWTSVSVSCNSAASEAAVWDWVTTADFERGAFAGGARLFSNTPCNGAAMFDSDFQDNGGDSANQGGGPCPAINEGYLISPSIDVSTLNLTGTLGVKFVNMTRLFGGAPAASETILGWSTDGGTNWSEVAVNSELDVSGSGSGHEVNFQRIATPNVTSTDNLLLRFRMVGNYYYWAIDDVQLIEFTGSDIQLVDAFFTPFTYAVPKAHADADTFFFSTNVRNTGGEVLNDVSLNVNVVAEDGSMAYTDSETFGPIGVNEAGSIALTNTWVPTGLDPGLYTINYEIDSGTDENDPNDNSTSYNFRITEDTWSKGEGPEFLRGGNDLGVAYKIGNIYITSPNGMPGDLSVEGITTFIGARDADGNNVSMTDNFVEVYLLEFNSDIPFFTWEGFDTSEPNILNNLSYDIVAQNTHVFTDEGSFDELSIAFNPDGSAVDLDPNRAYMAVVEFSDIQAGAALQSNKDLFYTYDGRVDASGDAIAFDEEDANGNPANWFLGGFGTGATMMSMTYTLASDVDDIPLPEGTFTAYPNPAYDVINTNFDFEEPVSGTLIVAGLDGKIYSMKDLENVTAASDQINVSNLASGTYVVRLSTQIGTKTYKIAVQH